MAEFLQSIWSPVLSLMLFLIIYSIGEWITQRTKGIVSTMVVASFVYIFLFVTNIIPKTSPGDTQLLQITGAFGSFLIITHLGTIIKFKDLINEWKTVLICLSGFVGILALCFTVGVTLFGKDYAYTAVAPISGGLVATQITAEAANAAGKADLAAFAFLVMSFQGLIGMPLASFFLKRQCDKLIAQGLHKEKIVANEITVEEDKNPSPKRKFFPPVKEDRNTWVLMLCKLTVVAWLGIMFSRLIPGGVLSPAIVTLFFGILFHELGFLDDNILVKAGAFNMLMLALFMSGPNSYSVLDFQSVRAMVVPLFGLLVVGAIGICTMCLVFSKLLKAEVSLSLACGLAAMFGFPGTYILTMDAVNGTGLPQEERQNLTDRLLPKMIVAGFTTVTIASVIFAGFLAPRIF